MNVMFDIGYHALLTRDANDGLLDEDQITWVVMANVAQDAFQTTSQIHFDNCDFPGGVSHIQDEWAVVDESGSRFADTALTAFGALLHTTQDFYAHSNWIELHQEQAPVPVWDQTLASLPPAIVSGTWWLGSPKLCGPNAPTHAELNKDSPTTTEGEKIVGSGPNQGKSLFDLAFATALSATKVQFARLARSNLARMAPGQAWHAERLEALLKSNRALRDSAKR